MQPKSKSTKKQDSGIETEDYTVKGIPKEVFTKVRELASKEYRSINKQLILIIEQAVKAA